MAEDPRDQVDYCTSALSGVCDLLAQAAKPERGDMHLVDPQNLYALLRTIRDQMRCASAGLQTYRPA
jgi:hypothetical protein